MYNRTLTLALLCLCALQTTAFSQDKLNIKFGKITAADFDLSKQKFDSGASAVVIADIGDSYYEGNSSGWFGIIFKRQTRIKILNKNGFDAANVLIPLYIGTSTREQVEGLKAYTYNLENGNVVATQLEKKSVFEDKYDKKHVAVKFTLPAVKEGCILEYTYTVKSDFYSDLQSWAFQGEYPVLWSEYRVQIPSVFEFAFLSQGYQTFYINKETVESNNYLIRSGNSGTSETFTFSSNDAIHRWVMKDVPPLKEENFTSTLKNHVDKIEFQLARILQPNEAPEDYMGNWEKVASMLNKEDDFGGQIAKSSGFLDDEMKVFMNGAKNDEEKARRIYAYLRDHITCTDNTALTTTNPLRNVWKTKSGNVAEINLLLVAMMRHENIQSYPVILSTRRNGYAHPFYPLIDRYNYVIAQAIIGSNTYYLDASEPNMGFNHLPDKCYNGQARVILENSAIPVNFDADSIIETKVTSVFLFKEKKDGELSGKFNSALGYSESNNLREKIKKKGESVYVKELSDANPDFEIKNTKFDSLNIKEMPVQENYEFAMKDSGDILYIHPMMGEGYKENWFKAAERFYPVEMPYKIDETYILNMEIPQGYTIEEIPKSAKISMSEGQAVFEYMIAKDADVIRLRSRVQFKKAVYTPEEYNELREFFSYIVKKHAEDIVLKKTK